MKKQILVTGGAGFVGTNLIKRLLKDGHEVVSIDNYSTGLESNHQKGAVYYRGDISNIVTYPCKPDIVYHLAAVARIQPSFDRPTDYFITNTIGTYRLATFCAKNNIPLVYAGTSSHHSGKFKNPYTFSKCISEEIIELCQRIYGLNATIARFYNVYGPHHLKGGGYCTLIGTWERCIELGLPLTIYGDGTKRRDFTHIDDIVEALLLIKKMECWNVTFELGRGENFSVQEIAQFFDYPYIQYKEDKPGEALTTLCTDTKARELLGWNPTRNIEDYIKNYIHENKHNTAIKKQSQVS